MNDLVCPSSSLFLNVILLTCGTPECSPTRSRAASGDPSRCRHGKTAEHAQSLAADRISRPISFRAASYEISDVRDECTRHDVRGSIAVEAGSAPAQTSRPVAFVKIGKCCRSASLRCGNSFQSPRHLCGQRRETVDRPHREHFVQPQRHTGWQQPETIRDWRIRT